VKISLAMLILTTAISTVAFAGPMQEKYLGRIPNLKGSYSSLVIRHNLNGTKQFIYFTEQQASGVLEDRCIDDDKNYYCPGISIHTGTSATSVGAARLVLDPWSLIAQVKLTRNGVAFSEKDKRYYALAYVNYGAPQTGYFFRSLTSNPAGAWESLGPISTKRGNYSGVNLIVNDEYVPGTAINHVSPLKNKFIHYTQLASNFLLMYSNDGVEWYTYKNTAGVSNLLPAKFAADKAWSFASVVKTKQGYFMSVTVGWNPIKIHRLLFSKDGLDWRTQIGTEPGGSSARKNFSLSYDPKTDTVYSMATESGSKHNKLLYSFIAAQKAR
jgi:hypothetical protein